MIPTRTTWAITTKSDVTLRIVSYLSEKAIEMGMALDQTHSIYGPMVDLSPQGEQCAELMLRYIESWWDAQIHPNPETRREYLDRINGEINRIYLNLPIEEQDLLELYWDCFHDLTGQ